MRKKHRNNPENQKKSAIAIRTWFLSFFVIYLIFSFVFPEDESGHTNISRYCNFVTIIVPTVLCVVNLKKQGKSTVSLGKSFIIGFLTWFILTGIFAYIDIKFQLSNTTDWFMDIHVSNTKNELSTNL